MPSFHSFPGDERSDRDRLKANLVELAKLPLAIFHITKPVPAQLIRSSARALSRSAGYLPTMFVFGLCVSSWLLPNLFGKWAAFAFNGLAWSTWGVVGCLAIVLAGWNSVTHLWRFGIRGGWRWRFWFEWGRLIWHGMFLMFVAATVASLIASPLGAQNFSHEIWQVSRNVIVSMFPAFAAVGIIGYLTAAIRRSRPRGRAFECVNWYLLPIGAMFFASTVLDNWPPRNVWPNGFVFVSACVLLVGCLAYWVYFGIRSYQESERRS